MSHQPSQVEALHDVGAGDFADRHGQANGRQLCLYCLGISGRHFGGYGATYREMPPGGVLPVHRFSQASPHSRTMFSAYLNETSALACAKNALYTLLVLAFPRKRKLVFRLSVGDFVDTEPLVGRPQQAWQMPFNILDVVQLRRQRVVDVDHDHFPVGFLFIEQGHHPQDLHLLHLAGSGHELTDLANVERIVVTLRLGLGVGYVGVLPRLSDFLAKEGAGGLDSAHLGESAIVPDVTVMRKTVADVTELALLHVLLDWIELLIFGDLRRMSNHDRFRAIACFIALSTLRPSDSRLTSILAFVQRGISTIMLSTVC